MGNSLVENIKRDLFILEDESNPKTSQVKKIWASTVIDQVFDDQSPTKKNLRDIIADLREEIRTGGLGNIVFPVTSVNGKIGDVTVTPVSIGMGKVDNTRDIDKPLSTPQKSAIMDILAGYDFKINLDKLYAHLLDSNNPHSVTIDQIDEDDALTTFVNRLITAHSLSEERIVHLDIRNSLSRLWNYVDDNINGGLDIKINNVLGIMNSHLSDSSAHHELFDQKENVINKAISFTQLNGDHEKYPSTRAVVEFVSSQIKSFSDTLPNITDYVADIKTIETRAELPEANNASLRNAYIIRSGEASQNEIAICKINPDKSYDWNITSIGSYSKFNLNHFENTADGMSIKLGTVIDAILTKTGDIDSTTSNILKDYYKKDDIENRFLRNIKILPGTMDGSIRYYINDDMQTMSDDIHVPGLKNLAYMEYITEKEIRELAVQNRHLANGSVDSRVIKAGSIKREHIDDSTYTPDMFKTPQGTMLGNISNNDGIVQSISLVQLGDALRPIIGGWPDINIPGVDTPLTEISPTTWDVGVEIPFIDKTIGMRFKGTISVLPNAPITTILSTVINSDKYQIISAGGYWRTDTDAAVDALIGGSNVLGNMFAEVLMTRQRLELSSISIGNRVEAPYDIWVRYMPR